MACVPDCAPGLGPIQAIQIRALRGSKGRRNPELTWRLAWRAGLPLVPAFVRAPKSQSPLPRSQQEETPAAGTSCAMSWAPPVVASPGKSYTLARSRGRAHGVGRQDADC